MSTSVIRSLPWLALFASLAAQAPEAPAPARQAQAPAAVPMARPVYLVVYSAGPAWKPDVAAADQLRDHGRFIFGLHQKKALKMAGPFSDAPGGAAVIEAESLDAARAVVAADPAVQSKVFVAEVHAWQHVDWDELARRLQARPPAQP